MHSWKASMTSFPSDWFQFSTSKNLSSLFLAYQTLTLRTCVQTQNIINIKLHQFRYVLNTKKNLNNINFYYNFILKIQWFWRALRSFDQAERAKFLQFVTGTSKVPLQGFGALEGMNGIQKFQIHRDDRSTDRLPSAHTWWVFKKNASK